jgi:hypothetical protein
MKEKEIDVYLALAALFQMLLIRFGGAFVTELVSGHPREEVIYFGSLLTLILLIILIYIYVTLFDLTKQKNHG